MKNLQVLTRLTCVSCAVMVVLGGLWLWVGVHPIHAQEAANTSSPVADQAARVLSQATAETESNQPVQEESSTTSAEMDALVGDVVPLDQTAADVAIVEKKRLENEIAEVRRTYKGQLTEYRQAEDQFVIAKNQFTQLNTLASLEVAVQASKKVFLLRDEVLLTYLKLLELELTDADGINLEEKTVALEKVQLLQQEFATHRDFMETAVDRVQINQAADDFMIIAPKIISASEYVGMLLKVGKLQTIYDKALAITNKVDPSLSDETTNALALNQKNRAYTEIKNTLTATQTNLQSVWDTIKTARLKEKSINITKNTATIHAQLSQVLTFLAEFLR